jgi:hypothetical protein
VPNRGLFWAESGVRIDTDEIEIEFDLVGELAKINSGCSPERAVILPSNKRRNATA